VSTFSGLILLLQTSELLQYAYLNIVIQMVQNIPKMVTVQYEERVTEATYLSKYSNDLRWLE